MRLLVKIIIGLFVLGVAGWLSIPPLLARLRAMNKPNYRQAEVTCGEIISVVNSSGTVKPVLNVQIGSYASGPIRAVYADFNDQVKEGQILAEVDPLINKAQHDAAAAQLACANARLLQADAKLEQTKHELKRAEELRPKKAISDADYDLAKANYQSALADVSVCKATINQNKGQLDMAKTYLDYTQIKSPVDGIIIERKVDPGQTVAAQFQTPELFKVAPEMEKRIHIHASVDEADIGLIRDAQKRQQPVTFTVDAYPNDLFHGKVFQVRLNPTTTQNVVTYPVIVEAPNAELKLLPGMTANLTFQIDKHEKIHRAPNAALRFYPKKEQVRLEDRKLLEGEDDLKTEEKDASKSDVPRSAADKAEAARKQNRRHVWILEGDFLKAVEITTGLTDGKNSEILSGSLKEGQKVVTGLATPKS
jgi:HlyD family secretion protein